MTREELSQMVELLRDTAKLHQPNEEILTDVKAESFVFIMDSVLSALSVPEGEYIKKEDTLDKLVELLPQRAYLKCLKAIDNLPTFSVPEGEKGIPKAFIDNAVSDNCKNLSESYGEICVKCNKCGRFGKG